ncbi:hypothetical protein QN277_000441 [Acacia crassicarpa]|uniref:Myb-like domain-containing protein n=1 Tax=Acacia crassicarpa TaxID=499986 RepID=A0AAE1N637_9FABA|nr:hypothetical protein QN277_000441 [Acacia crassicarpa]
MYLSEKPRPIDFYKEATPDMMIEVAPNAELPPPPPPPSLQQPPQHQMILGESSGEDHEVEIKAPKKRAETWISAKMKDKGFDRSPTMCTDKWRNLLKEFKKAKHQDRGAGSAKMSYYKDIEEILKERSKIVCNKSPTPPKVESYMQFSDKGMEDTGISFGPVEGPATGRSPLNLDSRLDHDEHPLAITAADTVGTSGVPPWSWRETPISGGEGQSCCGRVITVKWGDYTRRIGIDGTSEAIKEAIRAAFRLRSKRLFWLEDEYQIVRSLDRDMPVGNYTLHLDEGMAIKVCLYDESDQIHVHTEEKIFYTEEDHRDFLARRGWTCLRELDGFRNIDNLDDLQPGAIYRGVS